MNQTKQQASGLLIGTLGIDLAAEEPKKET